MKKVFADTTFWVALLNTRDSLHDKALTYDKDVDYARKITSEPVLIEFLNGFADKGPYIREAAVKHVEGIRNHPNIEVVPQTSASFINALERYRQRHDKGWGLTDCISMLIMEERCITEALTSDHHFKQAGFNVLLKP
jgi:predicted nucleic acid-binding protein